MKTSRPLISIIGQAIMRIITMDSIILGGSLIVNYFGLGGIFQSCPHTKRQKVKFWWEELLLISRNLRGLVISYIRKEKYRPATPTTTPPSRSEDPP
jgi:hypothetical protein